MTNRTAPTRTLSLTAAALLLVATLMGVSAPAVAADAAGNASVTLVSASAISFDREEGAVLTQMNAQNVPVETASMMACLTADYDMTDDGENCVPMATVEFL